MHEIGIAQSIYTAVCEEVRKRNISRIKAIGLEIGKMTAIVPDSLKFCFETIVKGSFLEGVELDIKEMPFEAECRECGNVFEVKDYDLFCPKCESKDCAVVSRDEILIKRLEVE